MVIPRTVSPIVYIQALASIIHAPGCGAAVDRTHQSLDPNRAFHCDRNYVCDLMLGGFIIILIRLLSGGLANSTNKNLSLFVTSYEQK